DRGERAPAELVEREARGRERVVFADGAGAHGADEVVEEPLPSRGVVEARPEERRLCRPLDEVPEARGRLLETREEERVDGRVPCGELRRVEIPALVVPGGQRPGDVVEVEPPGAMDGRPVLGALGLRERTAGAGLGVWGRPPSG